MSQDWQWVYENPEEAAAYIDELRAENDRLSKLAYLGEHQFEDLTYRARCDELLAESEQLRKDAERYRALRAMHWSSSKYAVVRNPKKALRLGSFCPSEENLDICIDSTMSKEGRDG